MRDPGPLWAPSPERADATRLAAFRRRAGAADYDGAARLVDRGTRGILAARVGRRAASSGIPVRPCVRRGEHFPDTRFFPDAQLSVAENLLRRRDGVDPEAAALVAVDETGAACLAIVGRAARRHRGDGVGAPRSRRATRRSRRHLVAERARSGDRHARRRRDRRGVLVDLARLRRRAACSTGSARSSRSCCSRPTATATAASGSTASSASRRSGPASRPCARTVVVGDAPAGTRGMGRLRRRRTAARRSHPSASRSTTRGTCCSRRAPPASRSASSTAPVACCCSTSRSINSTATSAPATASCTSRRPVG